MGHVGCQTEVEVEAEVEVVKATTPVTQPIALHAARSMTYVELRVRSELASFPPYLFAVRNAGILLKCIDIDIV